MFKMQSMMLMLLSALLPAHNLVVEGVTTTMPASDQYTCKEFTFSTEDLKNENSCEELLTIWRSKMVDVENFLRQTLLAQNGKININTEIIPYGVTTTASTAIETGTITSNRIPTPVATSLSGTSTIISSDATSLTPIATIIVGTSTITSNTPTLPTPIVTSMIETNSITSSDATWPTYLATSIGGTSTITANNPTSLTRTVTTIVGTSTITSDHVTSHTPVATASVHKTVTTPNQCEFIVSDICYWSYGKKRYHLNFTEAQQICADKGSVLAYFRSALAYNKAMESLRAKIKAVRITTQASAYTGVLINKQILKVAYPDTEVYMKWHPGNPKLCNDCTSVFLRFKSEPNSNDQGMWNYPPSTRVFGVVCQKNLN